MSSSGLIIIKERLELFRQRIIEARKEARQEGLSQSEIDSVTEYHLKGLLRDLEGSLPCEYVSTLREFLKEVRQ